MGEEEGDPNESSMGNLRTLAHFALDYFVNQKILSPI